MLRHVSERDQMMAAILAAPGDDGPRRTYADWLTRRGDPMGEFITLQLRDGDGHADWRASAAADAIRQQHRRQLGSADQGALRQHVSPRFS